MTHVFNGPFSVGYVRPIKRTPTPEELAAAKKYRAMKRITRAMDTNAILCADCGVSFFEYHDATIDARTKGLKSRNIKKCGSPFRDCKADAAMQLLRDGPPPRVTKITPKKIAAFKKRKVILSEDESHKS